MFSELRYGYGRWFLYGLWFLLPVLLVVLFFGRFFWIVIPVLFIGLCLLPRFAFRNRWMPASQYDASYRGTPPTQPSASDILDQRYARGEIDALTYDQMRDRLSDTDTPRECCIPRGRCPRRVSRLYVGQSESELSGCDASLVSPRLNLQDLIGKKEERNENP
jgi:uncharacterized membrane protein